MHLIFILCFSTLQKVSNNAVAAAADFILQHLRGALQLPVKKRSVL
jgi:hypothetical protein